MRRAHMLTTCWHTFWTGKGSIEGGGEGIWQLIKPALPTVGNGVGLLCNVIEEAEVIVSIRVYVIGPSRRQDYIGATPGR